MNGYSVKMEVKEGEIKEIMDRLRKAQETIYECYWELQELGVLTVVPDDDKKASRRKLKRWLNGWEQANFAGKRTRADYGL